MAISNKFTSPTGTRASLNALVSAAQITPGLIYLISDENRIAIGLTTSTYKDFARYDELGGNASTLNGQSASYYTNAANLATGTLPAARLPAISGDATSTAGTSSLTLASVNANVGTFGSSSTVPQITVNAKGLVTGVSQVTVAPAWSAITSKPTTLAGYGITDGWTASSQTSWNATVFNNSGRIHGTRTDFNAVAEFGVHYVQGSTNGPGTGSSQFYSLNMGLGADYAYGTYGMQLAIPRYASNSSTDRYLSFRLIEGGTWAAWQKFSAGNSDLLGGYAASAAADGSIAANSIVQRDANGFVFAQHFNFAAPDQPGNAGGPGYICYMTAGDNYVRKANMNYMAGQLKNQSNYISGINYYVSNYDTGGGNSAALEAYSNNGSGAVMCFHRGGYYAINMGLDSDNVFRIGGWSAAANRLQMDMSGNLTMAGNIAAYSDVSLKANVRTITGALDRVKAMRGVWFDRIETEKASSGVIAQEFEAVAPELVTTEADGLKSVQYGNTIGYLIEAIKELSEKVDAR